ncbi:MAG: protein-export chaperone SecB [Janthinobacterium lividum]
MSTIDEQNTPYISVNAQYIKDFSFENPNAPGSLVNARNPQVDFSLNVEMVNLAEQDFFEVEIIIEIEASSEGQTMFKIELKYAGIFHLMNIPDDQRQGLLAVYCPNMIFPFARQIIAAMTQGGGFQPLMIDPINFEALYYKKMVENQESQ